MSTIRKLGATLFLGSLSFFYGCSSYSKQEQVHGSLSSDKSFSKVNVPKGKNLTEDHTVHSGSTRPNEVVQGLSSTQSQGDLKLEKKQNEAPITKPLLFHFQKDLISGKVFIELEKDKDKLVDVLRDATPGISFEQASSLLETLIYKIEEFNKKVNSLRQYEVNISDEHLSPSKSISPLKPFLANMNSSSVNIEDLFRNEGLVLPITLLIPHKTLYERFNLPLEIKVTNGMNFNIDSVCFVNYMNPLNEAIETGVYFELIEGRGYKGNGGINSVIVPKDRLPFYVVSNEGIYFIGFDKFLSSG